MGKSKNETTPRFLRSRKLLNFNRDSKTKRLFKDNLSFFRCLSYFMYKSIGKAEKLYYEFYKHDIKSNFKGVGLDEISAILQP